MLNWFRFPVIALGLFLVFTSSSLIAQSQNKNNSDNKKNLDQQERLKKRDYWNKDKREKIPRKLMIIRIATLKITNSFN